MRRRKFVLLVLAVSALSISVTPALAPVLVAAALAATTVFCGEAWAAARGTALRPALVWAALAVGLSVIAQLVALAEPLAGGRLMTGRLTYLAVLALLAALVSVLNARKPGDRIWAGLMVLLIVVFLIPWLEEAGRMRRAQGLAQLRFDSPWTLFYGLLVIVGVTNYLPTRFGAAAACLALVFTLEYLGLTRVDWLPERRAVVWEWVSWAIALSFWVAREGAARVPRAHGFQGLWLWFRDHWGVVWALRVRERFNREAELAGWPVRLTWFGLEPLAPLANGGELAVPAGADTMLRRLLHRFALPWRLDLAADSHLTTSCDRVGSRQR
jgi:hypothetical protein